jgi:hypothetical protein
MFKQIRLAAATIVLAGAAYLSTPAHAGENLLECDLGTMIDMSDAFCGGGSFTISDIESGEGSCSWTVECHPY